MIDKTMEPEDNVQSQSGNDNTKRATKKRERGKGLQVLAKQNKNPDEIEFNDDALDYSKIPPEQLEELQQLEYVINQDLLTRGEKRKLQNKRNILKAKLRRDQESNNQKEIIIELQKKLNQQIEINQQLESRGRDGGSSPPQRNNKYKELYEKSQLELKFAEKKIRALRKHRDKLYEDLKNITNKKGNY